MGTNAHIGEAVRACRWEDYIGQTELKQRLDVSIEAAIKDGRFFEHMLLISRPGYGKTTLAQLIAGRLGDPIISFTKKINEAEFLLYLRQLRGGGIVLLDEIHAMPRSFQELLLTGLEDGYLQPASGMRIDVRHITFFGATTEPQKVPQPLWDRFTNQPHFADYSDDEMRQIISGMSFRANVEVSDDLAVGLARATGGTPRVAARLVAAVRDLTSVKRDVTVEAVLHQAGIDADGLSERHLDYLRTLDMQGGVAGIATLSTMLQMPAGALQNLERLLLSRGLMRLDSKGRTLTTAGHGKLHGFITAMPRPQRSRAA